MTETKKHNRKPILIAGIGNILLKDEGIDPHIIAELQKLSLPDHAELLDAGTAGADLLDYICDRQKVIFIDAIDIEAKPGTIFKLTGQDISRKNPPTTSLHELGIAQTLQMAKTLKRSPEKTVIIGVKPSEISCEIGLSKTIRKIVPEVIKVTLEEIETPANQPSN